MNIERSLTGAERVRKWRAAMRAKGLRPKTFWLPDTSTEEFQEQARRDSDMLTRWHAAHPDYLAEMEALQYWPEEEPD